MSDPKSKTPGPNGTPQILEIDTGQRRRWIGLLAYILLFFIVAIALVLLFIRFAGSVATAILLVVFMAGYMLIMGALASKNAERRD